MARRLPAAGSSFAPPSPPDARPSPPDGNGRPGRLLPAPQAAVVHRALHGGTMLPRDVRSRLERHLTHDLGQVRVHRGPAANAAVRALDTRAFAVGRDIVLGVRAPHHGTVEGLRLLAHEAAHVVQGMETIGGRGGGAARIRREDEQAAVSDGAGPEPVADEDPGPGIDPGRAARLNQTWWTLLKLADSPPLGSITPVDTPNTYANRVAAIQRASRVPYLRAHVLDRPLAVDGILGPRTFLFLRSLATTTVPAGDLQPFLERGVDLDAVRAGDYAAYAAFAAIRRPLVAARWTFRLPGDQVLRYYRQQYELNRDDAALLDGVLFGGPAPPDVTREDRHELLALLFGDQELPGVGALVTVNRRYLHEFDVRYVVSRGRRAPGRWSPYFAFRISSPQAADQAVADLSLSLPATLRARRVRDLLGEAGPPTAGLLVAVDIPVVEESRRQAVVAPYLARVRQAREERRREVEEHNRMAARQRADRFLELAGHRRDLEFTLDLQRLTRDFTRQPAFLFEYFLDDLHGRTPDQFDAFFDAVEGVHSYAVHAPVMRLALGTRYAQDDRVRRSLEILNSRRRGVMRSRYEADGVRLGGAGGPLLRVGEVAGDRSGLYLRDERLDRIKPDRMAELAQVAHEKTGQIYGEILAGRFKGETTQEAVATRAFELAAQEINLSDADRERDVDYEESVRLTSIRPVTEDGVERSYLTWEVVERWGGSGEWKPLADGKESGDDMAFDFRLSLYRLSQITDVVEGVAVGLVLVGAVALAWEAGLASLLIEAAGGASVVLTSVVLSELIYVVSTYRGGETPTLKGFLFAALDGYLGALAFRAFTPLGRVISARFVSGGTIPMRRLVASWLLSRAAVGGLSGAATMPASMFARELVEVLSGDQTRFSSLGDYLARAGDGALFGAAFEIAGSGFFAALRGRGRTALARSADVVKAIWARGIKPRTWLAESAGVLSRFRIWAAANLHADIVGELVRELRERLTGVSEALARAGRSAGTRLRADVLRQVIELADVELTRDATAGLERMLVVGQGAGRALGDDAAIAVLRRLRANPERIEPFLALMKDLQTPVLDDLVARGALGQLAEAPAALGMSARLTPTGTGALLRDAFGGSVTDLDDFARGLAGLDETLREQAWSALLDHRDLIAAVRAHGGAVTPQGVADLGRLAGHADIDLPGLRAMIAEFDAAQAQRFLADAAAAGERRLAELAELSGQGRIGARRYLQRERLAGPGRVPAGPDANAAPPPEAAPPVVPVQHPNPGPVEAAARAAVPPEDQIGFDIFMRELRGGGRRGRPADPEKVLAGKTEEEINQIALDRSAAFRRQEQAARAHELFHDNPLDPQLQITESLGDITLRYEGRSRLRGGRPDPAEIQQGRDVAAYTGERVEIFGDTVLGNEYPGIDGVIGTPRRPLSLKRSNGAANVGYARVHARDALNEAKAAGYSHVEVHINMYGSTVADIRAALAGVPANPRGAGPLFDAVDTVAKYVFHGMDGSFTLEPPL